MTALEIGECVVCGTENAIITKYGICIGCDEEE